MRLSVKESKKVKFLTIQQKDSGILKRLFKEINSNSKYKNNEKIMK